VKRNHNYSGRHRGTQHKKNKKITTSAACGLRRELSRTIMCIIWQSLFACCYNNSKPNTNVTTQVQRLKPTLPSFIGTLLTVNGPTVRLSSPKTVNPWLRPGFPVPLRRNSGRNIQCDCAGMRIKSRQGRFEPVNLSSYIQISYVSLNPSSYKD